MLGLQSHLLNANSMVVLAVTIWWIVCLWIDEPRAAAATPTDDANAPAAVEAPDMLIAKPSDSDTQPNAGKEK